LQEWIVNANPRAIAIDLDTDLIGQGAIDSLQMVNFLLFIEEIRGEEIPEALIRPEYFSTVRIIHDKFFDNKARQGGRHAG
jgi:acyl carrier protein